MSGFNEIYYWDTCLFIAWLKDESRPDSGELEGVREYIERLKKRDVSIITSVLTQAEITQAVIGAGGMTLFEDLLKRRNIQRIAVEIKIAKLARELRDYYSARPEEYNGKTLSVPDSLHLATAILHKVKAFHTFDKSNKKGSLGLLPLSGNVAGHHLIITKPVAVQASLDLRVAANDQ